MKKYKVTFEWFNGNNDRGKDAVTIEAGNKKNAWMKALFTLSQNNQYKECYKQLISIEEVA